MIDTVRTHVVGSAVENGDGHVDETCAPSAVHGPAGAVHRVPRPSSTALTALDASVHADRATFSPTSTDAKTNDEKLSLMTDNDNYDQQVDPGDNRRVERSDA
jgi:hypothetical protein